MQVSENPSASHDLLQRVREKDNNRLPGLHVSDLLYCARKAWFRLQHPDLSKSGETDADTLIFLLGRGHHELLEQGEKETRVDLQLNAMSDEGDLVEIIAHGTIDGLEEDGDLPIEFKTTRRSSSKSVLDNHNYIEQLASYCLARDTQRGRLYVLYISGDYKFKTGGGGPEIKAFDFFFEEEELDNWRDELTRRATIILDADNIPDIRLHYGYECERCAIKELISCPGDKNGGYDGGFFHTLTPPWSLGELKSYVE